MTFKQIWGSDWIIYAHAFYGINNDVLYNVTYGFISLKKKNSGDVRFLNHFKFTKIIVANPNNSFFKSIISESFIKKAELCLQFYSSFCLKKGTSRNILVSGTSCRAKEQNKEILILILKTNLLGNETN